MDEQTRKNVEMKERDSLKARVAELEAELAREKTAHAFWAAEAEKYRDTQDVLCGRINEVIAERELMRELYNRARGQEVKP